MSPDHITEEYIGWLNDPEVNQYLEVRFIHQTRATVTGYVESFYGEAEKYIWGIYAGIDQFIGTATLALINRIHGSGASALRLASGTIGVAELRWKQSN